jgi:hypothetical protein
LTAKSIVFNSRMHAITTYTFNYIYIFTNVCEIIELLLYKIFLTESIIIFDIFQQQRTTMILLCEDGSLRIYMANTENTSYWLSPYLQPQSPIAVLKPAKKKKVARSGHTTGSVSFPVDFFEHCYQTNDVEFGGNDLLQLYNTQQIKHRLTAIGMYVASTKVGT